MADFTDFAMKNQRPQNDALLNMQAMQDTVALAQSNFTEQGHKHLKAYPVADDNDYWTGELWYFTKAFVDEGDWRKLDVVYDTMSNWTTLVGWYCP